MLKIKITAKLSPTEDVEKVKKAVENLFEGEIIVARDHSGFGFVEGYSSSIDSLNKIYGLIRINRIVSAMRAYLIRRTRNNTITALFHKQAAYVGKISLVDDDRESPLGAIKLEIESADPHRIIDWLAPSKKSSKNTSFKPSHEEL